MLNSTSNVTLSRIPDGKSGIVATLRKMAITARTSIRGSFITTLSRKIVVEQPIEDKFAEAKAILDWVIKNVRYVRDPVEVELLMTPERTVSIGSGDCDDLSILIAALCESVGIPARFVAVQTREDGNYSHVYPEAWIDGEWIALDRASISPKIGKVTNSFGTKLIQPITISDMEGRSLQEFNKSMTIGSVAIGLLIVGSLIWVGFKVVKAIKNDK